MEVPFSPDEQARINQIASSAGRGAGEFVREVMTGYLDDLAEIREMLDTRYDDIKSGRVKPIDGEEAFARLRRKSEERRAARS
jgi:predicted DNA-binding protein